MATSAAIASLALDVTQGMRLTINEHNQQLLYSQNNMISAKKSMISASEKLADEFEQNQVDEGTMDEDVLLPKHLEQGEEWKYPSSNNIVWRSTEKKNIMDFDSYSNFMDVKQPALPEVNAVVTSKAEAPKPAEVKKEETKPEPKKEEKQALTQSKIQHPVSEHTLAEQMADKMAAEKAQKLAQEKKEEDKKVEQATQPKVEEKASEETLAEKQHNAETLENKAVAEKVNKDIDAENESDPAISNLISKIKTPEEYDQDIHKATQEEYKERNVMIKNELQELQKGQFDPLMVGGDSQPVAAQTTETPKAVPEVKKQEKKEDVQKLAKTETKPEAKAAEPKKEEKKPEQIKEQPKQASQKTETKEVKKEEKKEEKKAEVKKEDIKQETKKEEPKKEEPKKEEPKAETPQFETFSI